MAEERVVASGDESSSSTLSAFDTWTADASPTEDLVLTGCIRGTLASDVNIFRCLEVVNRVAMKQTLI